MLRRTFIFLIFVVSLSSVCAADETSNFRAFSDGSVEFAGRSFNSLSEYFQSDSFRQNGRRCGLELMSAKLPPLDIERQSRSTADCTNSLTRILSEYNPSILITIPVWFHIIQATNGAGFVSDAEISDQIQVLNEDFRAVSGTLGAQGVDAKIMFKLIGITRTTNSAWYTDSDGDELAYKSALRKDPSKFLNIYTNDARGLLGYAYLPDGAAGSVYDGAVMLHSVINGRGDGPYPYHLGRTLVHEVGHYLGMYHTFHRGVCSNSLTTGDLIADTNSESSPYEGSGVFSGGNLICGSRASCGTVDPVNNYMDYNYDHCMNRFTPQQVNRMICSLVNYRPGIVEFRDASGSIIPAIQLLLLDDEAA